MCIRDRICVVVARTWQMLPWYMAFLLGGLQGVSMDQIEAARIDGANHWQVFTHIVAPAMRGIMTVSYTHLDVYKRQW